jgi:hypothetical protein
MYIIQCLILWVINVENSKIHKQFLIESILNKSFQYKDLPLYLGVSKSPVPAPHKVSLAHIVSFYPKKLAHNISLSAILCQFLVPETDTFRQFLIFPS